MPMPLPLTMVGRIDECLLISLRTRAAGVERLVPKPLHLVTHRGFAFFNVVVCHIDRMRPRGVPRALGMSYHHVAYRLLVRVARGDGTVYRGLYFLRSDADSALVSMGGNVASDFRFHGATIELGTDGPELHASVASRDGVGDVAFRCDLEGEAALPAGSCFASMEEARRVLTYTPTGLAPRGARKVALAEVFRRECDWDERAVGVAEARWSFFESLGIEPPTLELATRVAPIDYRWRLGRTERVAG